MENTPFKIYNASAGSGKTFILVKEYLKVCLRDSYPEKFVGVLAITFTNKAASEMKNRIMKNLRAFSMPNLADGPELNMMRLIAEETGLGDAELHRRGRLVYEKILHNYSQFAIGTIDKFTHKVLKTFARDLGLSNSFEVEMDHKLLLKESVNLLIDEAGSEKQLTNLFVDFIQEKTREDKSWYIENDFYSVAEELLKESGQEYCEKLNPLSLNDFYILRKNIQGFINKIDLDLSVIGSVFFSECKERGLLIEWFAGGRYGIAKYFQFLHTKNWEKYIPSSSNLKNIEKDSWCSSKTPKEKISEINAVKEKTYPLAKKALKILNSYEKYVRFKLIAKNFYSLAVLREISKKMSQIKKQNNILPIGEFNKKIASVLQHEGGNFIYERMGNRYTNFFIDEFQDTSKLQWNNLLPLIENALADGERTCSAMLVGDAKQAIYRWRGGAVDQFVSLQNQALLKTKPSFYKMSCHSLKNNYRSKDEIVSFNNKLFSSISEQIEHEEPKNLFHNLDAQPVIGPGGLVSLEYIENSSAHNSLQLSRCLELIKTLKKEGFLYKDICILTRTKSKGSMVVKLLSDENIPVVSSESLLLQQSTEVRFLLNFLRFLNDPKHPRFRFKIIEYLQETLALIYPKEFINENIASLCKGDEASFYLFLNQLAPEFDPLRWRSSSLMDLCHMIIKTFKLNKHARLYMQFFLEEVWVYTNKYSQDLFGFLNYWEGIAEKSSITVPDGTNAVQVMTIHKSKGSEFPVVIFPFANWNATRERDAKSWVDVHESELSILPSSLIPLGKNLKSAGKEFNKLYEKHKEKVLLDNLNILYVALTRPKSRLYILTSAPHREKNLSSFFCSFLKSNGVWKEGKNIYVFGGGAAVSPRKFKKSNQIIEVETIKDLSEIISVSKNKMWESSDSSWVANKGKKIHEILSYIYTWEDLDLAIKKALHNGIISNNEINEIKNLLKMVIEDKEMSIYFTKGLKIKNEVDILLKNNTVLRPDRLVFQENNVTIIDYKTGLENKKHLDQILEYKKEIEKMGYIVESSILAYMNSNNLKLKRV